MTTGEKLARLRKENNHTPEQLAQLLGVSRQSVSKWESDIAFPETEKLVHISDLYGCSLDYLLKDESRDAAPLPQSGPIFSREFTHFFRYYERRSKYAFRGLPLWHICLDLRKTARGIIAIGYRAKGVVSIGLMSMGALSFGILSMGALSVGVLALGLLALGCISAGLLTVGSICIGVFACGALAVGEFAVGALAIGRYAAFGDHAVARIALGVSQAEGSMAQYLGEYSPEDVAKLLEAAVPWYLDWAKALFKLFL